MKLYEIIYYNIISKELSALQVVLYLIVIVEIFNNNTFNILKKGDAIMNNDNQKIQDRPILSLLTETQVKRLHSASLKILEETGVVFHDPEAVELLHGAGAEIIGNNRVKIPPYLVEEALRSAPSRIAIWDREGERAMELEGRNIYFGPGSDTINTIDPYTGERRKPIKKDICNVSVVCDFLSNIDFVMCMGIASDVPTKTSDLHHFKEMVTNTSKPIIFTAWDLKDLKAIYQMCTVITGGESEFKQKPFAINYSEVTSPLQHSKEATQKLLFCAEKDIPIVYVSGGYMGASVPVTRKGARIIGGGSKSPMDMRTALGAYGGPEAYLLEAIQGEISFYYNLPFFGKGGCSDSNILDQQLAIDGTEGLFLTGLSGINLIHDVGYLESGLTSSCDSIVLCNEIIGMVKRFIRGVEINYDSLALDVINKVGPGGNFIATEHTLKFFKKEIWLSELLNHKNYEEWVSDGKKSLAEVVNERTKWILEHHKPKQLNESIAKRLLNIIENREKMKSEKSYK